MPRTVRRAEITLTDRAGEPKDSASLKTPRPLLAALMLLAWLMTSGHMVLEHGGEWRGGHAEVACAGGHHDGDSERPGEPHHHHDLGVVLLGKAVAVQKVTPVPSAWTPLAVLIYGRLTPAALPAPALPGRTVIGDSPPDARSSGWLLIAHTARPVRGPAVVA